jgi:hypothetical protein
VFTIVAIAMTIVEIVIGSGHFDFESWFMIFPLIKFNVACVRLLSLKSSQLLCRYAILTQEV